MVTSAKTSRTMMKSTATKATIPGVTPGVSLSMMSAGAFLIGFAAYLAVFNISPASTIAEPQLGSPIRLSQCYDTHSSSATPSTIAEDLHISHSQLGFAATELLQVARSLERVYLDKVNNATNSSATSAENSTSWECFANACKNWTGDVTTFANSALCELYNKAARSTGISSMDIISMNTWRNVSNFTNVSNFANLSNMWNKTDVLEEGPNANAAHNHNASTAGNNSTTAGAVNTSAAVTNGTAVGTNETEHMNNVTTTTTTTLTTNSTGSHPETNHSNTTTTGLGNACVEFVAVMNATVELGNSTWDFASALAECAKVNSTAVARNATNQLEAVYENVTSSSLKSALAEEWEERTNGMKGGALRFSINDTVAQMKGIFSGCSAQSEHAESRMDVMRRFPAAKFFEVSPGRTIMQTILADGWLLEARVVNNLWTNMILSRGDFNLTLKRDKMGALHATTVNGIHMGDI